QGVVSLWPIRLPAPDDRKTEWPRSAREAAELAMTRWVRVKANMSLGAYEIFEAPGVVAEPVWPELSYAELLRIAFRERIITAFDHPVIKRLRGLAWESGNMHYNRAIALLRRPNARLVVSYTCKSAFGRTYHLEPGGRISEETAAAILRRPDVHPAND